MDIKIDKQEKLFNLFRLLDDESPEIQKIVFQEILNNALDILLDKEVYLNTLMENEVKILNSILQQAHQQLIVKAFSQILSNSMDEIDLEKSMLILSYWHFPELSCLKLRKKIDQLAERVEEKMPKDQNIKVILEHFNKVMFIDHDFRGNSLDYYNPDNSFLHKILETGLGIPISLSLLFILISRRLQLPILGISMPAHFILKYDNGEEEVFFDPFRSGQIYSRQNCLDYLSELKNENFEKILSGCSNLDIFKRMLKNLHIAYSSHTFDPQKVQEIEGFLTIFEERSQLKPPIF